MVGTPRWFSDTDDNHSQWYLERFRRLTADGADVVGEARLVDALVPPRSRLLDAGCGTGRNTAELHRRGHDVVGVDVDPVLIEGCRADHPGPRFECQDLTELDLLGDGSARFDAAVMAGNVMTFVAPGTESLVLRRVAEHLVPDGRLVVGFGLDRGYALADFDEHCAQAGLHLELRLATWDVRPFTADADFAVTLLRTPA